MPTGTTVTATFSEGVQPGSATFELRDASNALVPAATVAYDQANARVTLTPTRADELHHLHGEPQRRDRQQWQHDGSRELELPDRRAAAPTAGPGPGGGPIAVVTSSTNPTATYTVEILRAEGLNEFATITSDAR